VQLIKEYKRFLQAEINYIYAPEATIRQDA
jgi:hypothetical protein